MDLTVQHNIPESKICPRCDEHKNADQFYMNSARVDGLTYFCKVCVVDYVNTPRSGTRTNIVGSKKVCSNCARELDAAAFTYSQKTDDKLRPDCRSCRMSRKKNPNIHEVLYIEKRMAKIYDMARLVFGEDLEKSRSRFEQYVYQQMRIQGLHKNWKPPIWIHKTSIPE